MDKRNEKKKFIIKPPWHSDKGQLYLTQTRISSSTVEYNEEKQPGK